jgi:outer membrane autotransporter protein
MASTAFRGVRNAPPSFSDRWRAWAAPFGSHQLIGSNAASGAPGSAAATSGGGMGIERQFGDSAVVGFSAGGSNSSYSVADRSTSGRIDGGHLGLYGAVRDGPLYLSGNLGYSRFANTMTRGISVAGLPSELLTGDFSSNQFSARVELGWRQSIGGVAVTPFAAVQWANTWQQGYVEMPNSGGPATLALTYQPQSTMSLPASLGLQLDTKYALTNDVTWAPYMRAVWVHDFFPNRQITASFNAAPGFLFNTIGTPASADSVQMVVGSELALSKRVTLFDSFSAQVSSQSQAYAGTGGIRVAW